MFSNQKRPFNGKMHAVILLITGFFLFHFAVQAQVGQAKRYHVKSAKISYRISSPEGQGTTILFFDRYGMRESKHETLQKNGKTVKDQLTIINNGKAYVINLLDHTGIAKDISGNMQMMQMAGGKDMSATGMKMLKSMGGKLTGHENFLGKNCEKWELNTMGKTTMLIWQGIPLKTETRVMGMTNAETAISVKTGQTYAEADFQPPRGIKMETPEPMNMGGMQMSADDKAQMKKMMNMSYADFKKLMKQKEPDMSEEELKQTYNMMKQMGKYIK